MDQVSQQNVTWQRTTAIPLPPIENPLKLNVEASNIFFNGLLAASATTLYTVGQRTKALLREIHVCNKSSTDRTFTLRVVPYGQSTSDTYALYKDYPVQAKESITFHHHTVLYAQWFISALASNADDISIFLSGVEVLTL